MIRDRIDHLKLILKRKAITHLIWDYDGTLYQNPEVGSYLRQVYFKAAQSVIPRLTSSKFDLLTQEHGSWSSVIAHFTHRTEIEVIEEVEASTDKTAYITPNPEIVSLFHHLPNHTHIIFSNSEKSQILKGLKKIGFTQISKKDHQPFKLIIDRHLTHLLKPDPQAFQIAHSLIKQPKYRCLMIGDSERHDIAPAKAFGYHAIYPHEVKAFFNL